MFGSSILEVAIGIIFVYLFISLICSSINEGIASLMNKRGKNLFEGVKNLLNDPQFTGLAQQLYTHGLVDGISQEAANPAKPNRLPSYIPSHTFALALLDIVGSQGLKESWGDAVQRRQEDLDAVRAQLKPNPTDADQQKVTDAEAALKKAQEALSQADEAAKLHAEAATAAEQVTGPKDFMHLRAASTKLQQALAMGRAIAVDYPDPLGNIQRAIEKLPGGHTKESLFVLLDKTKRETALVANQIATAQHQAERLQANVEQWFNDAMDRVGGWYKRWTQKILLVIAVIIVFAANADTFTLANRLMRDNALRASIVNAAEQMIQTNAANPANDLQARQNLLEDAKKLTLPLGWVCAEGDPYQCDQVPSPRDITGWVLKVIGLLISAFAVSMGAPFWFDTLSKFVNLRGAGTPPGETKKSAPQPTKS
jgi:hypothetical protein